MTNDTLPHIPSMSVAYCIEYLNEKKDQLLGKKGLSLRRGERNRSQVDESF